MKPATYTINTCSNKQSKALPTSTTTWWSDRDICSFGHIWQYSKEIREESVVDIVGFVKGGKRLYGGSGNRG